MSECCATSRQYGIHACRSRATRVSRSRHRQDLTSPRDPRDFHELTKAAPFESMQDGWHHLSFVVAGLARQSVFLQKTLSRSGWTADPRFTEFGFPHAQDG